jgi:hypothetical protein
VVATASVVADTMSEVGSCDECRQHDDENGADHTT